MSQEQPPLRSRRELRQARDERVESLQDAVPRHPARFPLPQTSARRTGRRLRSRRDRAHRPHPPCGPGPVDSVRTPAGPERSSQSRARDRAALRTIKELAQKEEPLSGGGPPTRRQLRLQQLAGRGRTGHRREPDCSAGPHRPPSASCPGAARYSPAPQARPGSPRRSAGTPAAQAPRTESPAGQRGQQLPDGMTVEQALAARVPSSPNRPGTRWPRWSTSRPTTPKPWTRTSWPSRSPWPSGPRCLNRAGHGQAEAGRTGQPAGAPEERALGRQQPRHGHPAWNSRRSPALTGRS